MSEVVSHSDGVLRRDLVIDGDMAYGRLVQPGRNDLMNTLAEMRKADPSILRKMESMGWELSIPFEDYHQLVKKYPDLKAPHALTRTLAWKKFMGSAESAPYKVRGSSRVVSTV